MINHLLLIKSRDKSLKFLQQLFNYRHKPRWGDHMPAA